MFAGIDLGTTNSVIAIINNDGKPETLHNEEGKATTPSVIFFDEENIIVGDEAKERQSMGENNIASFFKRSMGDKNYMLTFHGKNYTPVDLSSIVLKKLKDYTEKVIGETITDVVITVPAYFDDLRRENTKQAGEKLGLNVLRIINEPTAAALGYGFHKNSEEQKILVYDLGGGTFDVTIVKVKQNDFQVLATDGNFKLGGKDWDDRIALYVGEQFNNEFDLNPLDEIDSYNDILVSVEEAKKALSMLKKTNISIHYKDRKASYEITRQQFNELTSDLMLRTIHLTEQVLKDTRLTWSDIDGVLLVGGSTRMPMVHEYIKKEYGKEPMTGVNVDEVVAWGAAIQAKIVLDQPNSNPNPFSDPNGFRLPNIEDVMSHSLGVVALNEDKTKYINTRILLKNKPIPLKSSRPYKHQYNKLEVYVTQGESDNPIECTINDKYIVDIISHKEGKDSELEIILEYDRNGIIQVSAKDESSIKMPVSKVPVPEDMSWLTKPPKIEVIEVEPNPNPMTIYLCIDISSSMEGSPLEEAQKAALAFIEKCEVKKRFKKSIKKSISIGLTSFNGAPYLNISACRKKKKIESAIDKLVASGGTNMKPAISLTHDQLKNTEGSRFIVILSDGATYDEEGAEQAAKECHNDNIDIVTIGIGNADKKFLGKIASLEKANIFSKRGDLIKDFERIAQVISTTGGIKQL